jgi:hypothetical protein
LRRTSEAKSSLVALFTDSTMYNGENYSTPISGDAKPMCQERQGTLVRHMLP